MEKRELDYSTYRDKVLGGWIGKSAGGILGAPIEGYKRFNNIELSEKLFETNYPNDDLDLQVLWLDMAKKIGPSIRSTDFGDYWKKHVDFPWNEYGIASRNLKIGVYPPQSGVHNNWYWKESMGCPIRSEIWGMLCPGMPEQAAFYARMDASLDHDDFSVHAEMFLSACEAEAFFTSDPLTIIQKVMPMFEQGSTLYRLVDSVITWHGKYSYEVCMGKIKSLWGDADFTSAPQNVGFSILALLESKGKFDAIMKALHLGHDSDCIAATVGAMLGIINGHTGISEQWKKMVGNELMVSPEIRGIKYAGSLSELADETCKTGVSFINEFDQVELRNSPVEGYTPEKKSFNLEVDLSSYNPAILDQYQEITLSLENLLTRDEPTDFEIVLKSDELAFKEAHFSLKNLAGLKKKEFPVMLALKKEVLVELKKNKYSGVRSCFKFETQVKINGKPAGVIERGLPYYGAWLLLGPFIEDNPAIEAMDEKYPDHGLSSMPGINYMNHDKLNTEKEYLSFNKVVELVEESRYESAPFLTQMIFPDSFKINLNKYFYGKGEKTLYLYAKVLSNEATKKWLAIGCNAYFKVWVNNELKHRQLELSRSWPADKAIEIDLSEGVNHLLIRIDMPLDKADIEIGFKDFAGKHAHQSQWDTELVPFV